MSDYIVRVAILVDRPDEAAAVTRVLDFLEAGPMDEHRIVGWSVGCATEGSRFGDQHWLCPEEPA